MMFKFALIHKTLSSFHGVIAILFICAINKMIFFFKDSNEFKP